MSRPRTKTREQILERKRRYSVEYRKRPFQKLIVINTALRARLAKPEGAR